MSIPSTYGPKPKEYVLDGQRLYIGAEVGNYLRCHRGKLYKQYPNLWRRVATLEEKRLIQELNGGTNAVSSNVMLVKVDEVQEILGGNEEKYKGRGYGQPSISMTPQMKKDLSMTPGNRVLRGLSTPSWMGNSMMDGPQVHSVLTALPVAAGKGKLKMKEIFDITDQNMIESVHANAKIPEELVPIRIDFEFDGIKVRDSFCYNKNETIITPEIFAELFCEDLDITNSEAVSQIAASIRQQIAAYEELSPIDDSTDQRAQIQLNINVQNENLTDTIEWDVSEPNNSPEEFAQVLCKDLQIGGEFLPSVAYSIRGQLAFYRKTYSHNDSQLPSISNVHPIRSEKDAEKFAPVLETMSEVELERRVRDADRFSRRMRRLNQFGEF